MRRGLKERRREREREGRAKGVCSESLLQWEHCCSKTNWVSAWAMGGSASKLLSSARAGGRLWEVKCAEMEPYGNPWSSTRRSFEGFNGQAHGSHKKKKTTRLWMWRVQHLHLSFTINGAQASLWMFGSTHQSNSIHHSSRNRMSLECLSFLLILVQSMWDGIKGTWKPAVCPVYSESLKGSRLHPF